MEYKDDITFIEIILSGNSNAFSFLIDRHKDNVFNLAFRICGNHEDAEEVAQDSFLKAYRSLHIFRMKSSFSTWLYRIVYNTAISHVRIKKKRILSLKDFPSDATDLIENHSSEEDAEFEYRSYLVKFALNRISEDERALISLYYYEEMSVEELSDVIGISKSYVKVKLFRARQKMLGIIEKAENKKLVYHE